MLLRSMVGMMLLLVASSCLLDAQEPFQRRTRNRPNRRAAVLRKVAASSVYKRGTPANRLPRNFVLSDSQWPQPDGLGSAITITYSYSNLLNGQMSGLSAAQLKQAVEEALGLWASVAPLNFVEVEDTGPLPDNTDSVYNAAGHADIRIGHHVLDGAEGPELAHAYLPFSTSAGLAGDLHFDRDEDWSLMQGGYFLETTLHEIGHTLGLEHEEVEDAIMNPVLQGRFTGLGTGELLPDDVAGIQAVYGEGAGTVTPLPSEDPPGDNEEPTPIPGVTVEANAETGVVTVGGDAENNVVLLLTVKRLLIVAGLSHTPVNEGSMAWTWLTGERRVECSMGGGNDRVYALWFRVNAFDCQLNDGDDVLMMLFTSVNELMANGGEGTDRFRRLFASFGSQETTGFE